MNKDTCVRSHLSLGRLWDLYNVASDTSQTTRLSAVLVGMPWTYRSQHQDMLGLITR